MRRYTVNVKASYGVDITKRFVTAYMAKRWASLFQKVPNIYTVETNF